MTLSPPSKQKIRAGALARRNGLDPLMRIEAAMHLADGAGQIALDPGTVVSGFLPIRSEMDIRPLMMALGERGARLCVPVIIDKETIIFREMVRGAALVECGFGTVGPGDDAAVLDPQILLVPLAAFDNDGNRIGYGAGYYDRAIARLRAKGISPRLIGIGFDCQHVERVPAESHDVPLDAVWTESGLRGFGPAC